MQHGKIPDIGLPIKGRPYDRMFGQNSHDDFREQLRDILDNVYIIGYRITCGREGWIEEITITTAEPILLNATTGTTSDPDEREIQHTQANSVQQTHEQDGQA